VLNILTGERFVFDRSSIIVVAGYVLSVDRFTFDDVYLFEPNIVTDGGYVFVRITIVVVAGYVLAASVIVDGVGSNTISLGIE
jgi:hypothetical protein